MLSCCSQQSEYGLIKCPKYFSLEGGLPCCLLCCGAAFLRDAQPTRKSYYPAQRWISREVFSGPSNTARLICNWECKQRSQKQDSYLSWFETNLGGNLVTLENMLRAEFQVNSLPFNYLTMPLVREEKLWKAFFYSTQKQTTKQMGYRTVKYLATVLLTSTHLCPTTQILWRQSAM